MLADAASLAHDVRIVVAPSPFDDWDALLALLHAAYAFMSARIDPPSSLHRMDVAAFREKARHEVLIVAYDDRRLVGCAFAAVRDECVYVGKLAVDAANRGRGIARRLVDAAATIARTHGRSWLELETRVELVENHRTFESLGFAKSGESAHAGFDRATSITMRKRVTPRAEPVAPA